MSVIHVHRYRLWSLLGGAIFCPYKQHVLSNDNVDLTHCIADIALYIPLCSFLDSCSSVVGSSRKQCGSEVVLARGMTAISKG